MAIEFPTVPKRTTTTNTPRPSYPANTPVATPTFIGDEPYRSPRPAQPPTLNPAHPADE
jgi:hypothetical protein